MYPIMHPTLTLPLLTFLALAHHASAACWNTGPKPPQYPIQMVEHLLVAGYKLQSSQTLLPGKDQRFLYSEKRNKDDKDCFTFEVKNNGKVQKVVDSVGAMDAWLRERT
jgi:hypothetical protein